MSNQEANRPSQSQRIALLIGWGFVIGTAAMALPERIAALYL